MSEEFISFFRPAIGDDEINEVVKCLKSGWLTTGGLTRQFEADFGQYIKGRHAVALNSCTAALHLALEAVGLQENELVLVPTMTFAATAEVVRYFKAIPVLVDCKETDLCMDMEHAASILELLADNHPVKGVPADHGPVRAVIPVHYGGQVADVAACRELCNRYDLYMIEDCAHCCPAYYQDDAGEWQMVGQSADIACFSFYANKTITTGEGGMAVTDNEEWADRMRVMSLHGISKDAWKRFSKAGSWYYEITDPGFKYNITDIASAIGIHQLKKADSFFQRRCEIAAKFSAELADVPGVIVPVEQENRRHSWHLYVIRIDSHELEITRDAFIEELKARNVGTSVHYIPLHLHPYYRDKFGYEPEDFPVATHLSEEILSLPIFPAMSDEEIGRVCDAVKEIAAGKK